MFCSVGFQYHISGISNVHASGVSVLCSYKRCSSTMFMSRRPGLRTPFSSVGFYYVHVSGVSLCSYQWGFTMFMSVGFEYYVRVSEVSLCSCQWGFTMFMSVGFTMFMSVGFHYVWVLLR